MLQLKGNTQQRLHSMLYIQLVTTMFFFQNEHSEVNKIARTSWIPRYPYRYVLFIITYEYSSIYFVQIFERSKESRVQTLLRWATNRQFVPVIHET